MTHREKSFVKAAVIAFIVIVVLDGLLYLAVTP